MPLNCGLMHYLEISFVPRISTAKQLHGRNWVLDYLEILLNRAVSPLEVKLSFAKFAIYSSCNMFRYVLFPHQPNLALALIITDPCTRFFHDKYVIGVVTKIRGSCNLPPCRERDHLVTFSFLLIRN